MVARGRTVIGGLVVAGLCLVNTPARSQESRGSLDRVLWAGPSEGVPSDAKRAVLTGLYVLSAASLVATGYFTYQWTQASDDVGRSRTLGACYELTDSSCHTLMDAQARVRAAERFTAASGAASAGFLLGAVLTAQYWDNATLNIGVSPSATFVQVESSF